MQEWKCLIWEVMFFATCLRNCLPEHHPLFYVRPAEISTVAGDRLVFFTLAIWKIYHSGTCGQAIISTPVHVSITAQVFIASTIGNTSVKRTDRKLDHKCQEVYKNTSKSENIMATHTRFYCVEHQGLLQSVCMLHEICGILLENRVTFDFTKVKMHEEQTD